MTTILIAMSAAAACLAASPEGPPQKKAARPSQRPVVVRDDAGLNAALRAVQPGTTILLRPGTYRNLFAGKLRGTADRPIVIGAADRTKRPVISGGATGLHLTDSAYVEVRDLAFVGQSAHALNIDDGGSYDTPSHHINLRNLSVKDIRSDAVKLAGVNDFLITGLAVDNCAAFCVDLVGCHDGVVEKGTFLGRGAGYGGIQAKGGSSDIVIRGNLIQDMAQRGVNIGGHTGASLFRPVGAPYEASRITVEGNVIVGGPSAVAFATCQDSVARYNTIYEPKRWAFRILAENVEPGMEPTRRGTFSDNIVAYRSTQFESAWNSSSQAVEPQTFRFARNWWFASDNPAATKVSLPTPETGGVIGKDPQFADPAALDFRPRPGSPAEDAGAYAPRR